MTTHICFAASGFPLGLGRAHRMEDRFELAQAAQECARILEGAGWTSVKAYAVRRVEAAYPGDLAEEHVQMEFRAVGVDIDSVYRKQARPA